MSYCVNCGVHLKDHIKECPLCNTRVINPNVSEKAFTNNFKEDLEEEEYQDTFDKNLWIKLISITLVTPGVISLLINWIFGKALSWSLYVNLSLLLVWVWTTSPFFFRHNRFIKWVPLGAISMLAFLYLIELISNSIGWFLPLALPITLSFFIIITINHLLINKKQIKELQIPALILISIGIFCVCINSAINLYYDQSLHPDWSLIVLSACLAFALVTLVLQQRPWIVEELKHWFRI